MKKQTKKISEGNKETIKKDDFITIKVQEKGVEAQIKYSKHSHLKRRIKVLNKLKEAVNRV